MSPTGKASRLRARELRVHFQGVKAVDGVDLDVARGEILGLIGPNGAGKTTLVNALSGFQRPTAGSVALDEQDVTGWRPQRLVRAGVARTFQSVRPFARLSVFENVELGGLGVGLPRRDARRQADEALERFGLAPYRDAEAAALPAGDERRLGIARALAGRPSFLLLDEPAAGLNEAESRELVATLLDVQRDDDLGVVLIEHDMATVMSMCGRIQVLDYGRTLAVGAPEAVRRDPQVVEAYLGAVGLAGAEAADA